jgi:hypothetical protein
MVASWTNIAMTAAKGIGKATWASPYGRSSLIGAGIGAAYGGFSDQTSVMRGAMMGAGAGLAGRYGYGLTRSLPTRVAWNNGAGRGLWGAFSGAAKSMGRQAYAQGRSSVRSIGGTMTRGYNEFKAMFR